MEIAQRNTSKVSEEDKQIGGGVIVEVTAAIHNKKSLKDNDKILDFMNSTKLIANLFRISQTEKRLKR